MVKLIWKPKKAINHAVNVVPIFAPIMILMASNKLSIPALTKLTTITVVADDDWMSAAMKTPVNTPFALFDVMVEITKRMRSPKTFCNASLISFIPKRNKAVAPAIVKRSRIPVMFITKNLTTNLAIETSSK